VGSAAALAAVPAPPRWLPPRDLSQKGADAVIPDVAFDRKGNAIVVWAEAKGSTWTVDAVERPPGGPWGAPLALSAPAGHVASPQLAVAGDSVVAVWARYDGKNLIVQASSRDSKTYGWSPPTPLSARGRDAEAPSIAVNARGDAVAVWASVTASGWAIESSYRPAGGSWQTPVPLQTQTAGTAAPDVVIDGTGRAVAVWAATAAGGWRVHAATRGTDGAWSGSRALSGLDASGSIAPQLALEGTNDVLAVWSRSIGSSTVIESATMNAATGTWAPAVQPFTLPHDALAPSVAVDKRGDGAIVWTGSDQTGLSVMATYRRSGKPWAQPVALSGTASSAQSPQVALDAHGDALAVWTQSVNGFSRVVAASLRAGGRWSAGRVLSRGEADALTARVALDQGGDGAAVWARYDGRSFVIQSGGYDVSGPALGGLSIPATGIVGRRLTFTVAPRDVWTTVGTIRWSFGDGSAQNGRATGHVYRKPGTYVARLTVADAFGHVTSVRRLVKISAA
jgi:hypothetical protein